MIGQFISVICEEVEAPFYWADIFEEYLELTADKSNAAVLELIKAEKIYNNLAFSIQCLCVVVSLDQSHEGAIAINDELRALTGRKGAGKMDAKEFSVHKNIGISFSLKAKEKKNEIDKLNVKGKESTKKDWHDQVHLLGKYQGYDILEKSVATYCSILNNFKEEIRASKKAPTNGK